MTENNLDIENIEPSSREMYWRKRKAYKKIAQMESEYSRKENELFEMIAKVMYHTKDQNYISEIKNVLGDLTLTELEDFYTKISQIISELPERKEIVHADKILSRTLGFFLIAFEAVIVMDAFSIIIWLHKTQGISYQVFELGGIMGAIIAVATAIPIYLFRRRKYAKKEE